MKNHQPSLANSSISITEGDTESLKLFFFFFIVAGKEHDKISLRYFDFKELERATKNFSQDCLLGSGAFGNVYKGTFDLEGTLAIKRAHSESFSSVEEFRNG